MASLPDLVVITPSRGRPTSLARLAAAVAATTAGRATVLGLVDDDDPCRGSYVEIGRQRGCSVQVGPRRGLVEWTNLAAAQLLAGDQPPTWLATLGDDHVPRTAGWDLKLIDAVHRLNGPGFAYGNDLLQGQRLPTAWVVHASIVRALGWMMLPTVGHMYPDNAIAELGQATGRLAYAPDVVIEHLHPAAGKAPVDASYAASNAAAQFVADQAQFDRWRLHGSLHADAARVASLTWAGVPA
jgi:hypothetical protein